MNFYSSWTWFNAQLARHRDQCTVNTVMVSLILGIEVDA